MATAATRLMTADEFFEWVHRPENRDRDFELIRGEVVEMPRSGKRHGLVCGNIGRIFGNFAVQRKKGYVCTNDTGVVIDEDTVRGPDIGFFEDAATYREIEKGWARIPPVVTVEVLSPHDKTGLMNERIADQLHFGVKLVWLVDPDSENVTVYRPGKEHYVVKRDQEITGEDVLPDFRCKVSEFFKLPGE